MNWMPIVNRELQVAARKRSTFWMRIVAALTAMIIGSGYLRFSLLPSTPFQMEQMLTSDTLGWARF